MAYNVEEQQELDNLKHFWHSGGKWCLAVIVALALAYLGYVLSKSHQADRQKEAATLAYQFVEKSSAKDATAVAELKTLQEQYADSFGATEATMMAAAQAFDEKQYEQAEKHLLWVQTHHQDAFLQALTHQRLAVLKLQQQKYDDALKHVDVVVAEALQPMMLETKGDILVAKGDLAKAKEAYAQALKGLDEKTSPNYELIKFKAEQ